LFHRGGTSLDVIFKSRLIRPAEAILLLVGVRTAGTDSHQQQQPSTVGTTMVFTLHGSVNSISPSGSLRVETPCYEMVPITLQVIADFALSSQLSHLDSRCILSERRKKSGFNI